MATEREITEQANEFARKNRRKIAQELTDKNLYLPDASPVAVFMAGSPGAGKTESSERLLERFGNKIIRIDSDELRSYFTDYDGHNSHLFQAATSIIAEKVQDLAIKQHQSYIFDGTLTNEEKSRENIERCLKRDYAVTILYVYQDPLQAWKFVKAREQEDGRVVPRDVFIEQYFKARVSVNNLKKHFGRRVQVDLIVKNIDGSNLYYEENIDSIDGYIPERYTQETLDP